MTILLLGKRNFVKLTFKLDGGANFKFDLKYLNEIKIYYKSQNKIISII